MIHLAPSTEITLRFEPAEDSRLRQISLHVDAPNKVCISGVKSPGVVLFSGTLLISALPLTPGDPNFRSLFLSVLMKQGAPIFLSLRNLDTRQHFYEVRARATGSTNQPVELTPHKHRK